MKPQIPIFYDVHLGIQANAVRLSEYYSWNVETDSSTTEASIRSLYHECFMDIVRAFGDEMIEKGRTDVYHEVLNDFLLRAATDLTTEEAASEFARIRRLYSKTQNSLTDTVYSTNKVPDFVAAYRTEYHRFGK